MHTPASLRKEPRFAGSSVEGGEGEVGGQDGVQDTDRPGQLQATRRRMLPETVRLSSPSAAHIQCHSKHPLGFKRELTRGRCRETPHGGTHNTMLFFYFVAIFRATSQQPSKQCLEHCCEVVTGSYRIIASYAAVSAPREGRTGTRSAWRREGNAPVQPSPPRYQRLLQPSAPQGDPPHLPGVKPGPRQQQHPSRGASPAAPSSPSWPQYAAARRCEWSQSIDCGTQSIDWRESSR